MKYLPVINLVFLLALAAYVLMLRTKKHTPADELFAKTITAERLNIIGKDRNNYVVISSPERQALATIDGELTDPTQVSRDVPGLLFFNQQGDEVGGLIFGIDSTDSYQLLTFDQRKSDQILTLRKDEYLENGDWKRQYGLSIQERSDRPVNAIVAELNHVKAISDSADRNLAMKRFREDPMNQAPQRIFIGRTYSEDVGIFLRDRQNRPRLKMYLDTTGNPRIEIIDESGNIDLLN